MEDKWRVNGVTFVELHATNCCFLQQLVILGRSVNNNGTDIVVFLRVASVDGQGSGGEFAQDGLTLMVVGNEHDVGEELAHSVVLSIVQTVGGGHGEAPVVRSNHSSRTVSVNAFGVLEEESAVGPGHQIVVIRPSFALVIGCFVVGISKSLDNVLVMVDRKRLSGRHSGCSPRFDHQLAIGDTLELHLAESHDGHGQDTKYD